MNFQANLGHMDTAAEQWKMIGGNLALTQVKRFTWTTEFVLCSLFRWPEILEIFDKIFFGNFWTKFGEFYL